MAHPDLRPPTPTDVSIENAYDRWANHGYQRVNIATVDSQLIPKIHRMLEKKQLDQRTTWLSLDKEEMSFGFSVPVRSRYILPVLDVNFNEVEVHPGLKISEILASTRSVRIQIGLSREDLRNFFYWGADSLQNRDRSGNENKPQWWPYQYPALEAKTKEVTEESIDEDINHSIYGYLGEDRRITDLVFETENPGHDVVSEWKDNRSKISYALSKIGKVINEVPKAEA